GDRYAAPANAYPPGGARSPSGVEQDRYAAAQPPVGDRYTPPNYAPEANRYAPGPAPGIPVGGGTAADRYASGQSYRPQQNPYAGPQSGNPNGTAPQDDRFARPPVSEETAPVAARGPQGSEISNPYANVAAP